MVDGLVSTSRLFPWGGFVGTAGFLSPTLPVTLDAFTIATVLRKEEGSSSMQLKLSIGDAVTSAAKSSSARYEVFVSCNKCAGIHEMGISVVIEDGPIAKKSIGALYDGKPLPKILSDLSNNSITCPQTGRQSTQKNHHQIFLVPPKR